MLPTPLPDFIQSEVDSLRLLHISDLHFGPPYVELVGEAVLRIAPLLKPDAVIVSGDLTQRAKRDQFLAAKAFLLQLPKVPQLVIPGNHDVPLYRLVERWNHPLQLYREIIFEELNPILRLDRAVIVGLDSTAPRTAISNGRINKWQLEGCEEAFRGVPSDLVRIVVAHHHFAPAPDYLSDSIMPKAKRSIERFVDLRVDMILGGHLHRAYIGNSLDFYSGNHRDRGIICVQCGTTTSRRGRGREREKNSLNLVEVGRYFISIIHYIYFHETGEFEAMSRHTFRRQAFDNET